MEYQTKVTKASSFEQWSKLVDISLSGVHPTVARHWKLMRMNTETIYQQYLHLDPIQRQSIDQVGDWVPAEFEPVEMKLRPIILAAVTEGVRTSALSTGFVSVSDLFFGLMVEAGPGSVRDRDTTYKEVTSNRVLAVKDIYDALQNRKS